MIERVKQLAARINALSVRERSLLFAVTISVLGALTDTFFITPLLTQQKALVAQIERKSSDMDLLREKVNAEVMSRSVARAAEIAKSLAEVQQEQGAIEAEIAALNSAGGVGAVTTSTLLSKALRHTDKVSLVRVVQAADVPGTAGSAANRGVLDITLAGNYLDLVDYLGALEKSLPNARWAFVKLKADASPVLVTVRIVTGAAI